MMVIQCLFTLSIVVPLIQMGSGVSGYLVGVYVVYDDCLPVGMIGMVSLAAAACREKQRFKESTIISPAQHWRVRPYRGKSGSSDGSAALRRISARWWWGCCRAAWSWPSQEEPSSRSGGDGPQGWSEAGLTAALGRRRSAAGSASPRRWGRSWAALRCAAGTRRGLRWEERVEQRRSALVKRNVQYSEERVRNDWGHLSGRVGRWSCSGPNQSRQTSPSSLRVSEAGPQRPTFSKGSGGVS